MGDIDELNSAIGVLLALEGSSDPSLAIDALLGEVQQDLLDLGGELSIPDYALLKVARVAALDAWLERANATLPRLQEFILPGGSLRAAQAHVCRTICRRAERAVVALGETQQVQPAACQYLNRLSDLMFVLARLLNRRDGGDEPQWNRTRSH